MRTCGPARALMLELWRKNLKFAIADECCFCNLLAGLASLKVTSATEGGYRIVAVRQFSKLSAGVRFPLPAPQSKNPQCVDLTNNRADVFFYEDSPQISSDEKVEYLYLNSVIHRLCYGGGVNNTQFFIQI